MAALAMIAAPLSAAVHGDHGASGAAAPHASGSDFDDREAIKVSQAAIGRVLEGYRFTDSEGRAVTLEQFRGRPLVVSLIYTSCYHICPTITQTVAASTRAARSVLGAGSFHVVTIGFDTRVDNPQRMHDFARQRGIASEVGWSFLSTDAATMERLSKDIGFIYFPSPKGFDHLSQTTVVDAEGKVYRQVYGDSFPLPALVEPLKDLVYGTKASATSWDGWVNGIKLFCTTYDPANDRYRFDYSLFVGLLAGVSLLGTTAFLLVREWRRGRKR
jgi:protein SCO1/2